MSIHLTFLPFSSLISALKIILLLKQNPTYVLNFVIYKRENDLSFFTCHSNPAPVTNVPMYNLVIFFEMFPNKYETFVGFFV